MPTYNTKFCDLKGGNRRIEQLSGDHAKIFCEETHGEVHRRIVHYPLISRVIDYQNKKSRQVVSNTKTRNEINCTGKKMFAQKGRGRSRHGDKSAPQIRGGAKAWGPKTGRVFEYHLNKKVRKLALASALTYHADRGTLFVIDDRDFSQGKTKEVMNFLSLFPIYPKTKSHSAINDLTSIKAISSPNMESFIPGVDDSRSSSRKIPKALFVGDSKENQKNTLSAVQNLNSVGINFIAAIGLNVKDLMNSSYVFIFKDALDNISKKCVF